MMQHLGLAYRTGSLSTGLTFGLGLGLGLGLAALALLPASGCLIPLPLEQQNSVDGGQLLVVTGAMPKFGSQVALMNTMPFSYQIDVISDSASLAGRLYLQVNGSCCDLKLDDSNVTRFKSQAQVTPLAQGNNLYTVEFNNPVVPCSEGLPAGSTVYVVPVLASGGFSPGPNPNAGIYPDGLGVVDRSHYWTVKCP